VRPGRYSTEINIYNGQAKEAPVLKRVIPLVLAEGICPKVPLSTVVGAGNPSHDLAAGPATVIVRGH